jgi:hypothetical protein
MVFGLKMPERRKRPQKKRDIMLTMSGFCHMIKAQLEFQAAHSSRPASSLNCVMLTGKETLLT